MINSITSLFYFTSTEEASPSSFFIDTASSLQRRIDTFRRITPQEVTPLESPSCSKEAQKLAARLTDRLTLQMLGSLLKDPLSIEEQTDILLQADMIRSEGTLPDLWTLYQDQKGHDPSLGQKATILLYHSLYSSGFLEESITSIIDKGIHATKEQLQDANYLQDLLEAWIKQMGSFFAARKEAILNHAKEAIPTQDPLSYRKQALHSLAGGRSLGQVAKACSLKALNTLFPELSLFPKRLKQLSYIGPFLAFLEKCLHWILKKLTYLAVYFFIPSSYFEKELTHLLRTLSHPSVQHSLMHHLTQRIQESILQEDLEPTTKTPSEEELLPLQEEPLHFFTHQLLDNLTLTNGANFDQLLKKDTSYLQISSTIRTTIPKKLKEAISRALLPLSKDSTLVDEQLTHLLSSCHPIQPTSTSLVTEEQCKEAKARLDDTMNVLFQQIALSSIEEKLSTKTSLQECFLKERASLLQWLLRVKTALPTTINSPKDLLPMISLIEQQKDRLQILTPSVQKDLKTHFSFFYEYVKYLALDLLVLQEDFVKCAHHAPFKERLEELFLQLGSISLEEAPLFIKNMELLFQEMNKKELVDNFLIELEELEEEDETDEAFLEQFCKQTRQFLQEHLSSFTQELSYLQKDPKNIRDSIQEIQEELEKLTPPKGLLTQGVHYLGDRWIARDELLPLYRKTIHLASCEEIPQAFLQATLSSIASC